MSTDHLMTQVSFSIKAPKGAVITKRVLNQLLDRVLQGRSLPKNVTIRGIFWRNPGRKGKLSYWRYHSGADLSKAPRPLESSPRGSLQEAIDTLAPYLSTGEVAF